MVLGSKYRGRTLTFCGTWIPSTRAAILRSGPDGVSSGLGGSIPWRSQRRLLCGTLIQVPLLSDFNFFTHFEAAIYCSSSPGSPVGLLSSPMTPDRRARTAWDAGRLEVNTTKLHVRSKYLNIILQHNIFYKHSKLETTSSVNLWTYEDGYVEKIQIRSQCMTKWL